MNDASTHLRSFFGSHGIEVYEGTVASVFQSGSTDPLARRIVDLSPSFLHSIPYNGVQLTTLPTPCLVVCSDETLLLVQKTGKNWVALAGAGYNGQQKLTKIDFELRFKPVEVVTHTGFETTEFTWRDYLSGFSRSNSGRLWSGFIANFIGSLASLAMPVGALLIIDKVLAHNGVGTLDVIILVVIFAEFLRFFVTVSKNIVMGEVAEEFVSETKSLLFDVMRNSLDQYSRPTSHSLYNALNNVERTRKIYKNYSVTLASELLFLLVLAVVMFSLSPLLAQVALAGVVVSIFVSIAVSRARSAARVQKSDISESNNNLFARLMLSAMNSRVMGQDHKNIRRWNQNTDAVKEFDLASTEYKFENGPINNLILNVLRAAIMWFGAIEVLNGLMTLGQFVAFNLIVALALGPVKSASDFVSQWTVLNRSAVAIQQILRSRMEQSDPRTFRLPGTQNAFVLEFRNFALIGKKDAPPLATGINLRIETGDKIALLGASGVGKSTFLNNALGLSPDANDAIFLNGRALKEYSLSAYRRRLGVLTQNALLSKGSVLENITLGENDFDMNKVIAATKQAHIHEVIVALDRGYDEVISDETKKLSEGQKQRVLLARALLNGRDALILDEPTSALDETMEMAVGQTLIAESHGRTLIVSTHSERLASLFDRVFHLRDGTLFEVGKDPFAKSVVRAAVAPVPKHKPSVAS